MDFLFKLLQLHFTTRQQKKLYIFGDFESAGALDFIYPEDAGPEDFAEAITELKKTIQRNYILIH